MRATKKYFKLKLFMITNNKLIISIAIIKLKRISKVILLLTWSKK